MKILYKQNTVIVGTGDQFIRLPPDLMAEFKRREVAIEVSNTYHASALYNLMCTEREGNGVVLFCKVMVKFFFCNLSSFGTSYASKIIFDAILLFSQDSS